MKSPEIIIIRETWWESLLSDASTFCLFMSLIGIGLLLDSSAMQWVGAIVGFMIIATRAAKMGLRMTVAEARQKLDEIERSKQEAV
jgi:uncharacterized membrane protein YadS